MVSKIDMAPSVIIVHHPAEFHQNIMKKLVENALKPSSEGGFRFLTLLKGTDSVKNFKNTICLSKSTF